jgi:hypothetical protein
MGATEQEEPTPTRRRFRYTPLSWIGTTIGILGWWIGKLIGETVGWSQFSLPGAALQVACVLILALIGFLTINYFFGKPS